MKRLFTILLLAVAFNSMLFADFRPIVIRNGGANGHDHLEQY